VDYFEKLENLVKQTMV